MLIDVDALKKSLRITGTATSCKGCRHESRRWECCKEDFPLSYVCEVIDEQPAFDAIPLEYISRYQKTCDGDLAMALEDLKASWQIVGPTWKPKR